MNAIANNPIFVQVSGANAHQALGSKLGSAPFANGFASLLNGMIDPQFVQTQNQASQTVTIDELLAQIDQLLAQLAQQQSDGEESVDQFNEAPVSEPSLQMIPAQSLVDVINILFAANGNVLDESDTFTVMAHKGNSTLQNNIEMLSSVVGGSNHNLTTNASEALIKAFDHQPAQKQLLQSLQTILHAVKDGQMTFSQAELGKLSQFLEQLGANNSQGQDLKRNLGLQNHHLFQFNSLGTQNSTRVVAPLSETIVNQSGSQPMQQEQMSQNTGESITTTKAGFHQMMLGNIQNSIQTASSFESTQPVVRAQHFQTDMNDFLVRQLQMTRFPNGVSEARIKLFPENLGSVEVKLTVQQGVLTALFMAETRAGKELLESQLAGLRASLLSSGLQVDKLEVNMPQNPNQGQAQDSMYRQGSDQRNQQATGEELFVEDETEEDFSTVFEQFSEAI